MAGKQRTYTKKKLEKFFNTYCNANIVTTTGMPSTSEVARACHICRKTAARLRDKYGWEARRLKIIAEAEAELDKKRVASTVSKVSIYENLEKAGLNYLMSKLYQDADGKVMVDLKPAEVIAISKHAGLLRGDPDSRADMGSERRPVRIVLNFKDNGMDRMNGKKEE